MNDDLPPPPTTDEPMLRESIPDGRLIEATLAIDEARSRGNRAEIKAILARYPDLAGRLRDLLALEELLGLDRPWADPLRLLVGAPLRLKYDVLQEANHGAFGRVWKARDRVLGRFVAIKVFKPDLTHESALTRFIEEPQVAGQLDHPGVVPVHELGKTPDGRPYIVMKWVEGPTLHDLLRGERSREDLPRFLEFFKQICRIVGCAHRKWGVLHRDLKPANIMIGVEGEVLVMDWGLSKVLLGADDEPGAEAPAAIETVRSLNPALATVAGTAVGTYAYMAPEQALGKNDEVKAWSDVFALGAILCEILTGRSPYWTTQLQEPAESAEKSGDPIRYKEAIKQAVQARAKAADLDEAFTRLDACEAAPELKGLARKCLSAASGLRPADAGVVADAVAAYQNGLQARLREKEVKEAALQAEKTALQAKEAALRSRLTAVRSLFVAAGVIVLFVAVLVGVGFWYGSVQEQKRQEQAAAALRAEVRDKDARVGLDEVDADLRGAKWDKAKEELRGVEERLAEGGPPTLQERVLAARRNLKFIEAWQRSRSQRSHVVDEVDFDDGNVAIGYRTAFHDLGIEIGDASAAGKIVQSPIHNQLLAALDHWILVESYAPYRDKLLTLAHDASAPGWGRAFRDPASRGQPGFLVQLAQETPVQDYSPVEIESMAWALLRAGDDAEPLLRGGLSLHGDDFWLNLLLALALERKAQGATGDEARRRIREEAVEYLRASLALQPRSAFARTVLGVVLTDLDRTNDAVKELKESLGLQDLTPTRCALVRALIQKGDLQGAQNIVEETDPSLRTPQLDALFKQIQEAKNRQ